jgi:hypothetical protein
MAGFLSSVWAKNAVRSAWRTFVQTFVGLFSISMIGWLNDVTEWAGGEGLSFPGVDTLGKAAVSALSAAVVAVIAFVHNAGENKTGTVVPLMPRPVADHPVVPDTQNP